AFLTVASLADVFVDRFLDGLVARVPAFFQVCVEHQPVAGAALLLAGTETTLGVAAGLTRAGVPGTTAVARGRKLDSPEQAGNGDLSVQNSRGNHHPPELLSLPGLTLCAW